MDLLRELEASEDELRQKTSDSRYSSSHSAHKNYTVENLRRCFVDLISTSSHCNTRLMLHRVRVEDALAEVASNGEASVVVTLAARERLESEVSAALETARQKNEDNAEKIAELSSEITALEEDKAVSPCRPAVTHMQTGTHTEPLPTCRALIQRQKVDLRKRLTGRISGTIHTAVSFYGAPVGHVTSQPDDWTWVYHAFRQLNRKIDINEVSQAEKFHCHFCRRSTIAWLLQNKASNLKAEMAREQRTLEAVGIAKVFKRSLLLFVLFYVRAYVSGWMSTCIQYLTFYLSAFLVVCLFVCLSFCPSVFLFVC